MASNKRRYGDLSNQILPKTDPALIADVFRAFTGRSFVADESRALKSEERIPQESGVEARSTAVMGDAEVSGDAVSSVKDDVKGGRVEADSDSQVGSTVAASDTELSGDAVSSVKGDVKGGRVEADKSKIGGRAKKNNGRALRELVASSSVDAQDGHVKISCYVSDVLAPQLTPTQWAVYYRLYRLSHGIGKTECLIGNKKLREQTGVKETAVRDAIAELRRLGLVEVLEVINTAQVKGTRYQVNVTAT
jgi:hypothetical protein